MGRSSKRSPFQILRGSGRKKSPFQQLRSGTRKNAAKRFDKPKKRFDK
jgi:hypothetical protein